MRCRSIGAACGATARTSINGTRCSGWCPYPSHTATKKLAQRPAGWWGYPQHTDKCLLCQRISINGPTASAPQTSQASGKQAATWPCPVKNAQETLAWLGIRATNQPQQTQTGHPIHPGWIAGHLRLKAQSDWWAILPSYPLQSLHGAKNGLHQASKIRRKKAFRNESKHGELAAKANTFHDKTSNNAHHKDNDTSSTMNAKCQNIHHKRWRQKQSWHLATIQTRAIEHKKRGNQITGVCIKWVKQSFSLWNSNPSSSIPLENRTAGWLITSAKACSSIAQVLPKLMITILDWKSQISL